MMKNTVEPFVLKNMKPIPPEPTPNGNEKYDHSIGLWVCVETGAPIVEIMSRPKKVLASSFGETSLTETREGVDRSENIQGVEASSFGETTRTGTLEGSDLPDFKGCTNSPFGETAITKTSEGTDQTSEVVSSDNMFCSSFGETTSTRSSREGVDHSVSVMSQFGETIKTSSSEGSDQANQ